MLLLLVFLSMSSKLRPVGACGMAPKATGVVAAKNGLPSTKRVVSLHQNGRMSMPEFEQNLRDEVSPQSSRAG